MNTYRARRATTDDLAGLIALWHSLQMPAMELERCFTDFQVAEDSEGKLVGAIAVQISGVQGRLHSETIPDFSVADSIRPLFWERIQSIARNHGLVRLWTEETAVFWRKVAGFAEPPEARRAELPPAFGSQQPGWMVLQLRSDEATPEAIERQIELIKASHEAEFKATKRKADDWARKGKALSAIGIIISLLLFITGIIALFRVLRWG